MVEGWGGGGKGKVGGRRVDMSEREFSRRLSGSIVRC